MSFLVRLVDRIDAKLDRPADRSVLDSERNRGSEAAVPDAATDQRQAAAANVRRKRDRRRWPWLNGSGGV